jgi:diaminopimelate decarboxylase
MESMTPAAWGSTPLADLHDLAAQYGTPYFLYDSDQICSRIRFVRETFASLAEVFFAVKANPNLELLRAIRSSADGLDISSEGELAQAGLAGYEPSRLSFAGPAKTVAELSAAIDQGVGCISIESMRELADCVSLARASGKRAQVVVRVNPRLLNRSFGLKMGGRHVQFGIDEEQLADALDAIRSHPSQLQFRGLHVYAGSQCFEPAGILEGVRDTLRLVGEVERMSGLFCSVVNLGGGFGVSHGEEDRELDVGETARALVPVLRDFLASSGAQRRLVFELGRYLSAAAGIYVSRVVSAKESRGKRYFIADGGLHHHLAAAGTFGATLRSNFALRNLSRPGAPVVRCNIAGPSCNPTDLLGVDVDLPAPEPGDLIGVLKSGSYGLTASPLLFLGRRTPVELVRKDSKVILGRRSRPMTDFN